jgi:hypothetical protein
MRSTVVRPNSPIAMVQLKRPWRISRLCVPTANRMLHVSGDCLTLEELGRHRQRAVEHSHKEPSMGELELNFQPYAVT